MGGTLCFQFFYSASGASFTWTSQGTNLIFVLISTYKLLTNLFYTFCMITAALRNWISLVKVSYQGNFHGRFLTIIFATFSKSGSQIVLTCISCSLPWWRPHRKHFVHKKTAKKCARSNITSNFLFVTGKQSILHHCVNCLETICFDIAISSRCSIMLFSVVCFATDYINTFVWPTDNVSHTVHSGDLCERLNVTGRLPEGLTAETEYWTKAMCPKSRA